MKLGQQVLTKIQDLLADIGQSKKSRPPLTNRPNQQNISDNSVYDKLYGIHRAKQAKNQQRQWQKAMKQKLQVSPFKVTNKHTIFINSLSKQKPIHQRLDEIKQKQYEQLQRLKQKYPNKQSNGEFEKDEERIGQQIQIRRRNERKYTKKQVEQKMKQMQDRQKIRMQKLNRLKINAIQNHSKEFRCKPYINKGSSNMWNRYKLKKDLSNSVFQRFHQYEVDRRANLEVKEKQIRNKITPFAPKISENSRILVSKSPSRSDLHKPFNRSLSCRCFQKGKNMYNKDATMTSSRMI